MFFNIIALLVYFWNRSPSFADIKLFHPAGEADPAHPVHVMFYTG